MRLIMRTEVVVFTLHESGKSFIEIARELNLQAKEVAVLWARAMTAKNKFETREKVVYRKIFTAGELLKELNFIAADIGVDDVRHHPGWPKAPNSLTRKLRGILSNLRDAGVLVTIGEHGEVGRMITIERVNKEPKTSSEPSGPSEPF